MLSLGIKGKPYRRNSFPLLLGGLGLRGSIGIENLIREGSMERCKSRIVLENRVVDRREHLASDSTRFVFELLISGR